MLLLAGAFSSIGDAVYDYAWGPPPPSEPVFSELRPTPEDDWLLAELEAEAAFDPVLSVAIDLNEEADVSFDPVLNIGVDFNDDADLFPGAEEIELDGGARIGSLLFGDYDDFEVFEMPGQRQRIPVRPPGPRLHSDPGIHSILTARRMMSSGELIQGSCYRFLSEVYDRAGHRSWRKRRVVFREGRDGPYANLDLIRPGDWLYIVNDPGRTPVGTHSVMFVRWTDKARGYGSVISHPGWGAPTTGRESTYDLSMTYRIIRPTD